jgi:hypothetical protein
MLYQVGSGDGEQRHNIPDLLTHQSCRPFHALASCPGGEKELAEEGIERFLDAGLLVAPGVLLLFERGKEPLQD